MRRTLFIALAVCLVLPSPDVRAEEPFEQFLEALQERGQYDLAVKYLDRIATSKLVSSSIRDQVDFRRGALHGEMVRNTQNPTLRRQHLDAAEKAFEEFLAAHSDHPSSGAARSQLGNVVVERARSLMKQAARGDANSDALRQQASEIFSKATELLDQSRVEFARQLDELKGVVEREDIQRRDTLRSQYVAVKLARARVLFEHADALVLDEKKFKAKLTEAAQAFDEIAEKYRKVSAGVYAVLYEGQCYQRLGDDKRALSYFMELWQLSGKSAGIRKLKTKALTLSIASWLKDEQQGHELAITNASQWLTTTRGNEDDDPDWIELRLALAQAYYRKSIAEDNKARSQRALAEARKIARELSTRRGVHQQQARSLLVKLGYGEDEQPAVAATSLATAENFAAALSAAKKSLDAMKEAETAVKIMAAQVEKISDPQQREEIENRLATSREREQEFRTQALELFERADQLATADDLNEWNSVRYFLSFLYYSEKQYRRAAVLADFVASRYPESIAARECANVALAAHQELYKQLPEAARANQSARIGRIAELMISRWPGQSVASNALTTLLNVTVQRGELDRAESYLAQIPEDSPNRASAELRTGQAVWREYLKGVQASQSGEATLDSTQLDGLKLRAQRILAQGIARLGHAQPDDAVIRSALSLAQIYVETGEADKAIEILNHPHVGPLTLVEQGSPWTQRIAGYAEETYKTAIRAHVAAAAAATDTEASIQEAQRILDRLRQQMANQPNGQQTMIGIYVGLARDLERQLALATPDARRTLSRGFESFVRSAGQSSDDVAVLNWVAETWFSLGKGFQDKARESTESKRYFSEAAKAYDLVLKLAKNQPDQISSTMLTQVRARQAIALREVGEYKKSIGLFAIVLAQRETIIDIQAEAAKTLQAWGDAGQADAYLKAIGGDRPGKTGKNTIWGWGRLAAVVGRPEIMAKNPSFRDTFYDARYNIALCRYQFALKTPAKKQELLKRAKQDVLVTNRLYKLTATNHKNRFESLLKAIQKSLGEDAIGFAKRTAKS